MTTHNIAGLSISILKSILFTNHVNAGLILEKSELVLKVQNLIESERQNRERQRLMEAFEQMERDLIEADNAREREEANNGPSTSPPKLSTASVRPTSSSLDRDGLCVVCYDNDANIAIVDCGYVLPH
jgi:hypothetical protein